MSSKYIQEDDHYTRSLFINDNIEKEVITPIIEAIVRYNEDDIGIPTESRLPINLYITSIGGDMSSACALSNVMLNSKTPIYTHNLSEVASAALLIFLSGSERFGYPDSRFMFHGIVSGFSGDERSIKVTLENHRIMEDRNIKFTTRVTKYEEYFLRSIIDRGEDYYFGLEEAYEKNVVTQLLIPEIYSDELDGFLSKFPDLQESINLQDILDTVPLNELTDLYLKHKS